MNQEYQGNPADVDRIIRATADTFTARADKLAEKATRLEQELTGAKRPGTWAAMATDITKRLAATRTEETLWRARAKAASEGNLLAPGADCDYAITYSTILGQAAGAGRLRYPDRQPKEIKSEVITAAADAAS